MLAPLRAPKTVPPPTDERESLPGIRPIQRSTASTTFAAKPVRISKSPIRTKSGIGIRANLPTDENAFIASNDIAPSPPRKK